MFLKKSLAFLEAKIIKVEGVAFLLAKIVYRSCIDTWAVKPKKLLNAKS